MPDTGSVYVIRDNLAIPAYEVWFEFSHASGPGGQHVNKTATCATLCFSIANSGALTTEEKLIIGRRLANRIGADGILQISSRESRSQTENRRLAGERFCQLLADALKPRKRRIASKPTFSSKVRRLETKRFNAERKAGRRRAEGEKDSGD